MLESSAPPNKAPALASDLPVSISADTTSLVNKANKWDKKETLLLLNKCMTYKEKFQNPKLQKKDIFKRISDEMKQGGCHCTAEQCTNRMKTLLTKYKEVKDYNNTSGNDRKNWEYYEAVRDYVGDRPTIEPIAGCSSLNIYQDKLAKDKEAGESVNESSLNPPLAKRKRKISQNPRTSVLKWLDDYKIKQDEMERKRIELVKKHHDENKDIMNQLLEALKND